MIKKFKEFINPINESINATNSYIITTSYNVDDIEVTDDDKDGWINEESNENSQKALDEIFASSTVLAILKKYNITVNSIEWQEYKINQ